MDDDEARTIGQRVRQIRYARRKSLQVIAGLAGISTGHLSRIERGERLLDSMKLIVALAGALQIPVSELTKLPVPAPPANGHTDSAIEAVRLALDAIEVGRPDGQARPVAALRDQVVRVHQQRRACQFADVAVALPALIRDLHSGLTGGTDHGELLGLAVYLHVHVTRVWLVHVGAPADLLRRTVFLARDLAQERDEVAALSVATFGVADVLLTGGAFELGQAELDSLILPPVTTDTAALTGLATASHALAAALDGRPEDVAAPMEAATEVAERFGGSSEPDSLGFVFGPTDAGVHQMWLALEMDEPDRAVAVAQGIDPERHPFATNRAYYWVHYGRALARVRGRRNDAVMALRTAEELFPTKVRRDPMVRDVLADLLARSRRDAVGRELRGMAYRAGLPV